MRSHLAADLADTPRAADTLDPAEVAEILAGLSAAEWQVLHRSASLLGRRVHLPGADILQEACLRMLQGKRRCRRHRPFRRTITGVMRSLVSTELDALEGERRPVIVPPEMIDQWADETLSPAKLVVERQADIVMLDRLAALIDDDPGLVTLADALCDGLHGEALRQHLGLAEKELATLKRRLARRIADLLGEYRRSQHCD